jgi:hypothetical protein
LHAWEERIRVGVAYTDSFILEASAKCLQNSALMLFFYNAWCGCKDAVSCLALARVGRNAEIEEHAEDLGP